MPTAQLDFEKNIASWWREVKDDFWGDVKQEPLKRVKTLMEASMHEELVVYTQAQWHERTGQVRPYRNGSYTRALSTELGLLPELRVPRTRDGRFRPTVLPRYQRRQAAVNGLLQDVFLAGVSTRRVGEVVQPLLGVRWSATTLSTVTKALDAAVHRFHRRTLLDEYQVLFLDGVTMRVKDATGVKKRLVLVAYGLTVFGQRVLLSFRQAPSESATAWEAFLNDLSRRGLEGTNLQRVVTVGCRLPVCDAPALLGPQAAQCREPAAAPAPGRRTPGGQDDLPGPDAAGGRPALPALGATLAGDRAPGGRVPARGSRGAAPLPGLPRGAAGEAPDDERHRALLPRGQETDAAHRLLHEYGEL